MKSSLQREFVGSMAGSENVVKGRLFLFFIFGCSRKLKQSKGRRSIASHWSLRIEPISDVAGFFGLANDNRDTPHQNGRHPIKEGKDNFLSLPIGPWESSQSATSERVPALVSSRWPTTIETRRIEKSKKKKKEKRDTRRTGCAKWRRPTWWTTAGAGPWWSPARVSCWWRRPGRRAQPPNCRARTSPAPAWPWSAAAWSASLEKKNKKKRVPSNRCAQRTNPWPENLSTTSNSKRSSCRTH